MRTQRVGYRKEWVLILGEWEWEKVSSQQGRSRLKKVAQGGIRHPNRSQNYDYRWWTRGAWLVFDRLEPFTGLALGNGYLVLLNQSLSLDAGYALTALAPTQTTAWIYPQVRTPGKSREVDDDGVSPICAPDPGEKLQIDDPHNVPDSRESSLKLLYNDFKRTTSTGLSIVVDERERWFYEVTKRYYESGRT